MHQHWLCWPQKTHVTKAYNLESSKVRSVILPSTHHSPHTPFRNRILLHLQLLVPRIIITDRYVHWQSTLAVKLLVLEAHEHCKYLQFHAQGLRTQANHLNLLNTWTRDVLMWEMPSDVKTTKEASRAFYSMFLEGNQISRATTESRNDIRKAWKQQRNRYIQWKIGS